MTEFEMLKNALIRLEHKLNVVRWENINEQCIEDFTEQITYYFKDDILTGMENNKELPY